MSVTGPRPTEVVLPWPYKHSEPPYLPCLVEGSCLRSFSSALDRVSKQMFLITASLLIGSLEFPQRLVGKDSEEQRVMFHINLPLGAL